MNPRRGRGVGGGKHYGWTIRCSPRRAEPEPGRPKLDLRDLLHSLRVTPPISTVIATSQAGVRIQHDYTLSVPMVAGRQQGCPFPTAVLPKACSGPCPAGPSQGLLRHGAPHWDQSGLSLTPGLGRSRRPGLRPPLRVWGKSWVPRPSHTALPVLPHVASIFEPGSPTASSQPLGTPLKTHPFPGSW